MASSGSGTMTPAGGGGATATFASPLPHTLLSLTDYARLIGLNPAHFWTAYNSAVMPYTDCCTDIWFQHDWQFNGRTSREALAQAIGDAERDIAETLGYWPAPKWIAQEVHRYPRHHRPDVIQVGGYDSRSYRKSIVTDYGYIIAPGQRAVSRQGSAAVAVTYSSEDGDAYNETATVSVSTSLSDACEIKVYVKDKDGEQDWEIRPARTKKISGGTFTATFWAWQMIDPDLWDALPTTTDATPIDWNDTSNLLSEVDIYREYNDTTETSVTFYWEPESPPVSILGQLSCSCGGSGCAACTLTTQDGCLHLRDPVPGVVVPQPADYDDDDAAWEGACWSVARDPDMVKIYYYAGDTSNLWRRDAKCEMLSPWWQQTIAWLATARLERPFCSCDNVVDLVKDLRTDLSQVGGTYSYNVTLEDLSNPFGPRKGAVLAWRRISKLAKKIGKVAVV